MYDQNPLLHKLSIEDLAREYEDSAGRRSIRPALNPVSVRAVATVAVIVASVLIFGPTLV